MNKSLQFILLVFMSMLLMFSCFNGKKNPIKKLKPDGELEQVKLEIYNNFVRATEMKNWEMVSKFYNDKNLKSISNGHFKKYVNKLDSLYFSTYDSTVVRGRFKIYCEGTEIGRISSTKNLSDIQIFSEKKFVNFTANFDRFNVTYARSESALVEYSYEKLLGVLVRKIRCFENYDLIIESETLLTSSNFYCEDKVKK